MVLGANLVRVLAIASLGLGACSWTFDEDAPDLPLVGAPPSLSSLKKLNNGPVYGSAIVRGIDGAYWIALQEETKKLRVLRLSAPDAEQSIAGDQFVIAWRSFFVWENGDPPTDATKPRPATLRLQSAGQDAADAQTFDFPNGIGQLIIGGADNVFVYVPPAKTSDGYELVRRAGYRRSVPFPGGPAAASLAGAMFSSDAEYFFDRAPCAEGCMTDPDDADRAGAERRSLVAHSTREEREIDLGLQPRRILLYEPSATTRRFFTCGSNGVRIVPLEETAANPARVLDEASCASEIFTLQRVTLPSPTARRASGAPPPTQIRLFYEIGGELRQVPIDGSAPPSRVLDREVARVLNIFAPDLIVYSQDPGDRYIYGVGDGWIGDWRFMNRGRLVDLTSDRKRIHFLENAAQNGGIGDLSAADIGGPITRLARNVFAYSELDDGRILAAANHAFRGTQNRIIVIDEKAGHARWVADQASRYSFIPGSTDLLVDIVTGASSADLVRVPLPPAE